MTELEKLVFSNKHLKKFVEEEMENDCYYNDNCPLFVNTKHGTCNACKARYLLEYIEEEISK